MFFHNIGTFIATNWTLLLALVLVVALLAVLLIGKKNKLVLQFMLLAEKKADDYCLRTGEDKISFVADFVLSQLRRLPFGNILAIFIPRTAVIKAVDYLLYQAYDYVDDGKFDDSWTPEEEEKLKQELLDNYNESKSQLPESVTAVVSDTAPPAGEESIAPGE